jgi:hypothetical protein
VTIREHAGGAYFSGGRPAALWVCVACIVSNYLIMPYLGIFGLEVTVLGSGEFMPVTGVLLGLAGARSYEKGKGVAREK